MIESALSIDTLQRKPKVTWRYLLEIDGQVCAAAPQPRPPGAGRLERWLRASTIMTVNVDRLHQRAGRAT